MSKIEKKPLVIPTGVDVKYQENKVLVKGPKGELSLSLRPEITLKIEEKGDRQIFLFRNNDSILSKSLHGLSRSLLANIIKGVTEGYTKALKIIGTGYRARLEGKNLVLTVGFSHPVIVVPKPGIEFEVKGTNQIIVKGIDKQLVGQVAADIRKVRPPDAYKGKGIRYKDEIVKTKPGKTAKIGAAA